MHSDLRIGIIGYGGIARLHQQAIEQLRGLRLAAVADPDVTLLDGLPASIERFSSEHELLRANLDAVIICSPTRWHAPTALAALTSGKHVLVEKPMSITVAEGQAMCKLACDTGLVLMVGMTHRFYPEFREAKRLVDDGAIGEVLMCSDTIIEPVGGTGFPRWYLDKTIAGGGVAISDGIHLVDRVRWFAGREAHRVTGCVGNHYFGSAVEDSAQMHLWFGDGVAAQLTMAFMSADHPLVCELRVVGTKGSILVRTWQGYTLHDPCGTNTTTIYKGESHAHKVQVGLQAEIAEFCSAIREGRAASPSPEDSLKALEIVQAFYVAAAKGTIVTLE
jgi:predicted dehydrogenase